MNRILEIKGKTKFKITLDSGSWIFDDRKVDLDTYFSKQIESQNEEEISYEEKMSNYWNREIREGSYNPPTLKSEKSFKKQQLLTGTFGIPLEPFVNNAEPLPDATNLVFVKEKENVTIPLEKLSEIILKFSHEGKPLKEDGPVHVYYKDGSNFNDPITDVIGFILD